MWQFTPSFGRWCRPNQSNFITLVDPGNQTNREGDNTLVYVSRKQLPWDCRWPIPCKGCRPAWKLLEYERVCVLVLTGTIQSGAASGSPYHVTLTATDGLWSGEVTLDWFVAVPGTVDVTAPGNQFSLVNDIVNLEIQASSSLSEPLTYSASGLPNGLSIDPQTGVISGTISLAGVIAKRV